MQNKPVELTPRAVRQLQEAINKEYGMFYDEAGVVGIRIGVKGGGCKGYYYDMGFQTEQAPEDWFVYDQWGMKVFVDPYSGSLLDGTVVDYVEALLNSGFKFNNPNEEHRTCGCGKSFG